MAGKASIHVIIRGIVQGVFFRAFVVDKANVLRLSGWVRNLPGGKEVEVMAEGDRENLRKLLEYLNLGPQAAKVEEIKVDERKYTGKYKTFTIRY